MSEPLAQILATEHHGHPLLRIVGEVDMSNAPSIGEQLRADIGLATSAYIDLTDVGFFDSQGLRMLQRLHNDVVASGSSMVLIAPPTGVVGSILALTGMDKTLDVRPSLPSA